MAKTTLKEEVETMMEKDMDEETREKKSLMLIATSHGLNILPQVYIFKGALDYNVSIGILDANGAKHEIEIDTGRLYKTCKDFIEWKSTFPEKNEGC